MSLPQLNYTIFIRLLNLNKMTGIKWDKIQQKDQFIVTK